MGGALHLLSGSQRGMLDLAGKVPGVSKLQTPLIVPDNALPPHDGVPLALHEPAQSGTKAYFKIMDPDPFKPSKDV